MTKWMIAIFVTSRNKSFISSFNDKTNVISFRYDIKTKYNIEIDLLKLTYCTLKKRWKTKKRTQNVIWNEKIKCEKKKSKKRENSQFYNELKNSFKKSIDENKFEFYWRYFIDDILLAIFYSRYNNDSNII